MKASKLKKKLAKIKPQPQFEIKDKVWGFRIQGTIHPDTENPCEVWIYDTKKEPRFPRVRMCGRSMVHVLQAATAEAIKRYEQWLDKQ